MDVWVHARGWEHAGSEWENHWRGLSHRNREPDPLLLEAI